MALKILHICIFAKDTNQLTKNKFILLLITVTWNIFHVRHTITRALTYFTVVY